jgi:glycosyltransferase involved in cell wall biosynthesis
MSDDNLALHFSPPLDSPGLPGSLPSFVEPAPLVPHQPLRCAAIVPAYNEAGRITNVLKAVAGAQTIDELLVICDGCDDTTGDEARGFAARWKEKNPGSTLDIRVLELEHNLGKGGAMRHGALHCTAPILLFLDADLIGLTSEQVDAMVAPMRCDNPEERAAMSLGLFGAARGGIVGWWLSLCHRKVAAITGQRAIRRDVFLAVPDLTKSRFGVETAITRYVRCAWKLKVAEVFLHGVTHPIKEEKIGVFRGLRYRMAMYLEILSYIAVDSVRGKASSRHREEALQMRRRFSGGISISDDV